MPNEVGILGAGFGLYGHLPAALKSGASSVLLPARYQKNIELRTELHQFLGRVIWTESEIEIFRRADTLVFARRPKDNALLMARLAGFKNIKRIVVEKPLGASPQASESALAMLENKSWRLSLPFRHLFWSSRFSSFIEGEGQGNQNAEICWKFNAHHFQHSLNSWKARHSEGGGALRYYGIHMIALLAEAGYRDVAWSKISFLSRDVPSKWEALFESAGRPRVRVLIDSAFMGNSFLVRLTHASPFSVETHDEEDPFSAFRHEPSDSLDRRVTSLQEVYESFSQNNSYFVDLYKKTLNLWRVIERKSSRELNSLNAWKLASRDSQNRESAD